jgi:hypothetical protein
MSNTLTIDYQPSQITGWGGATLGGHIASADFTFQGTAYTLSLAPFGQAGDSPDPVYEDVPADPVIGFQQTLTQAWGEYYSFRYLGGQGSFSVQSYSVYTHVSSSSAGFGCDLYLVYQPSGGYPAVDDELRFIQVVSRTSAGTGSAPVSVVDNNLRANPFYMDPGGGVLSVNGTVGVSFYDRPGQGVSGQAAASLAGSAGLFEVFLARDTGLKDASSKGIVNIFGGVKWGWQVQDAS